MKTLVFMITVGMLLVAGYGESTPTHPKRSQANSSGCFIKTAAFGTPLAGQVIYLQNYRNELMQNEQGRSYVDFYYRISPSISKIIGGNELLKSMVRTLVKPAAFTTSSRSRHSNQSVSPMLMSLRNYR